jgi:C4-dicarboxylate-specific signal transduction histidine kinase
MEKSLDQIQQNQDPLKKIENSKMLELGYLTGSLGHEINNILAIIMGKVSSVKRKVEPLGVDPKILEELEKISSVADRIGKIVKAIKSFAREGSLEPLAEVELKIIIDQVLQLEKKRLIDHKIELKENTEYLGPVFGRNAELTQCFVYLINHAYDVLDGSEGAWIQISSQKLSDQYAVILFTDSSLTADGIQSEKVHDQGLGLSFAKRLIEHNGGQLFRNEKSLNNQFVIVLPLKLKDYESSLTLESAQKLFNP